jgi:hypothetical protein
MVRHFVSDTHKVMRACVLVLFSLKCSGVCSAISDKLLGITCHLADFCLQANLIVK